MFFEQAREQAQRAYERDGTDAAVSLCVNNEVSLRKSHCVSGKLTLCNISHAVMFVPCLLPMLGIDAVGWSSA